MILVDFAMLNGTPGMLIRALCEHLVRRGRDSAIGKLTKAFITVQVSLQTGIIQLNLTWNGSKYNSLLNNARYPDTNWYSPRWLGPAIDTLYPWGQLAAIDVLISAINLGEPIPGYEQLISLREYLTSLVHSPAPLPSQTQQYVSREKQMRNIIIGGILGGVSLLAMLAAGGVLLSRGRRRNQYNAKSHGRATTRDVHPFPICRLCIYNRQCEAYMSQHRCYSRIGSKPESFRFSSSSICYNFPGKQILLGAWHHHRLPQINAAFLQFFVSFSPKQ